MSRPPQQGQAGTSQSDQVPPKNDGIPNATTCCHGLILQATQKKRASCIWLLYNHSYVEGDTQYRGTVQPVSWRLGKGDANPRRGRNALKATLCLDIPTSADLCGVQHLAAAPSSAHLFFSCTQTRCFSNLAWPNPSPPRKAKGGAKGHRRGDRVPTCIGPKTSPIETDGCLTSPAAVMQNKHRGPQSDAKTPLL